MGIPWINVLFTNYRKQIDERFRPISLPKVFPDIVLCPFCKDKIAKMKLDKIILVYKCRYGHELSEEAYYNYHNNHEKHANL